MNKRKAHLCHGCDCVSPLRSSHVALLLVDNLNLDSSLIMSSSDLPLLSRWSWALDVEIRISWPSSWGTLTPHSLLGPGPPPVLEGPRGSSRGFWVVVFFCHLRHFLCWVVDSVTVIDSCVLETNLLLTSRHIRTTSRHRAAPPTGNTADVC